MTTPTAPIASTAKKSSSSNSSPQLQDTTKQTLIIRCPRCDSSNTKFCYYNNYSLSQPRHFCKTCRRYWTQGGALRNVPVGGGCRKNKKLKSSEISSSGYNKFFPSAVDFQLGGGGGTHQLYGPFGLGTLNPNNNRFGVDPPSVLTMGFNHNFASNQSSSHHLASSIESLSCINQDMHWKLQQQRLSVLFATDTTESHDHQKHGTVSKVSIQQSQMEEPMEEIYSSLASASKGKEEWLFVNSGSSVNIPNSMGDHDNLGNPVTTNWSTNGVQATWGL